MLNVAKDIQQAVFSITIHTMQEGDQSKRPMSITAKMVVSKSLKYRPTGIFNVCAYVVE
jgi:hypothetical protein